jgi:hypothetical protein
LRFLSCLILQARISTAITKINAHIIDYADKFNVEGAILFLDFSKAFDSLEWEFMYLSLEKIGFQKYIIKQEWFNSLS